MLANTTVFSNKKENIMSKIHSRNDELFKQFNDIGAY